MAATDLNSDEFQAAMKVVELAYCAAIEQRLAATKKVHSSVRTGPRRVADPFSHDSKSFSVSLGIRARGSSRPGLCLVPLALVSNSSTRA